MILHNEEFYFIFSSHSFFLFLFSKDNYIPSVQLNQLVTWFVSENVLCLKHDRFIWNTLVLIYILHSIKLWGLGRSGEVYYVHQIGRRVIENRTLRVYTSAYDFSDSYKCANQFTSTSFMYTNLLKNVSNLKI